MPWQFAENAEPDILPLGLRFSGATGFPSPADDELETPLNLHQKLVKHPAATFFARAGQALRCAGIRAGDLLVIDRAVLPSDGHVVVAVLNGELVLRQLVRGPAGFLLQADRGAPTLLPEQADFALWGVVTFSIHAL